MPSLYFEKYHLSESNLHHFKGSHVLLGLRRLSFLHALIRTSEQRHSWSTSGQTCGPGKPRPQLWLWCCSACTRLAILWPGLQQVPQWEAVINANIEANGIPVHKLDGMFGLDGGNGCIDIFGNHVAMVQQAVLATVYIPWLMTLFLYLQSQQW
uniref:uncharacterized protein LOC118542118 n=1 Tax=Halichoerus grypus TaxID=9711 RepID=UPI00165986EB|nr:uncharacterized protein LOC118542118 [Halichoerus grypus]